MVSWLLLFAGQRMLLELLLELVHGVVHCAASGRCRRRGQPARGSTREQGVPGDRNKEGKATMRRADLECMCVQVVVRCDGRPTSGEWPVTDGLADGRATCAGTQGRSDRRRLCCVKRPALRCIGLWCDAARFGAVRRRGRATWQAGRHWQHRTRAALAVSCCVWRRSQGAAGFGRSCRPAAGCRRA